MMLVMVLIIIIFLYWKLKQVWSTGTRHRSIYCTLSLNINECAWRYDFAWFLFFHIYLLVLLPFLYRLFSWCYLLNITMTIININIMIVFIVIIGNSASTSSTSLVNHWYKQVVVFFSEKSMLCSMPVDRALRQQPSAKPKQKESILFSNSYFFPPLLQCRIDDYYLGKSVFFKYKKFIQTVEKNGKGQCRGITGLFDNTSDRYKMN